MKIGFIGLGIMGSRMAANLQKHGHILVLFNRTPAKAKALLGGCGTLSESPAKLAEQVDVLFTMLANPDAVEQAALGENGFLDHLNNVFPVARQKNVSFVIGSSLNAGFISGSPRYNYGTDSYKIPAAYTRNARNCVM